ncbi:hypothetical protein ACROYT_G010322 [Oculina patagonica]
MVDLSRDKTGIMDKCMVAMREDLAPWISRILSLEITVETLMEDLDTGVVLCRLANAIQRTGEAFLLHNRSIPRRAFPPCGVTYKERTAFRGSFIARDNVANFIRWCRELGVSDVIMFETEDLVLHKNEKSVILTLMDVARLSVKFGVEPPDLVRMENEIDQEIEQQPEEIVVEPMIQLKKKHKSHSLDDLVYEVLEKCTCPVRYPVLRVGEGKYRVGEGKSLIFVRVMRKHVMVRVGGGWDTLERYFDKHDPCKVTERHERRNSVKSPRSRSGSDVIGRSPSSMSISSTDSHDSCGMPVSHGRTASWTSSQNSSSQLKSPRDPVTRVTSVSPTRSPSSSPRLRQRRGTMSRDTPPRTIDTQPRGRLSRKSKSMQELNSVYINGRSPSYSKPTSSSIRKNSVTGDNSPRDGASGGPEQSRRKSLATSSRKSSNVESPAARGRLSSSGPVGSQRPGPPTVSRSASFGSRPRTLIPVMEPRSKTMVSSQPAREPQRRASSALSGRVEYRGRSTSLASDRDETRRREPSAKRRSSSVVADGKARLPGSPKLTQRSAEDRQGRSRKPSASAIDGKARLPGSPKPAQRSAEDKQERSRKTSVSKLPSPRHKPEQPASPSSRKISTGGTEQGRPHRSLPSTPRERKSSTTQQNGPQNSAVKGPKSSAAKDKTKGLQAPPTSPRENKLVIQRKELARTKANESVGKERTIKIRHEDEKGNELGSEQIEDDFNTGNSSVLEDSTSNVSNGQLNGKSNNFSEYSDAIDDISCTRDISSPDERLSPKPTTNGRRKTSECSLETDSDVTSDLLSDLTDTDFDLRSQRYSGLSETSSDISFGTSPAWKLFHSVELERRAPEPDSSELEGSQQTLRDCLMNLNLQGSITPTMKRRIFEATSARNLKDELSDLATDSESRPVDKAMFFDVEHYNDNSPDEEDAYFGSPRKLSLVKSLISSIEKRSGSSSDVSKVKQECCSRFQGPCLG